MCPPRAAVAAENKIDGLRAGGEPDGPSRARDRRATMAYSHGRRWRRCQAEESSALGVNPPIFVQKRSAHRKTRWLLPALRIRVHRSGSPDTHRDCPSASASQTRTTTCLPGDETGNTCRGVRNNQCRVRAPRRGCPCGARGPRRLRRRLHRRRKNADYEEETARRTGRTHWYGPRNEDGKNNVSASAT